MSTSRALCWFSCGAASAIAARLAVHKYGERAEVLYCDTLRYEHPDNARFMRDVSAWLGREIKVLRSEKYKDIYDVFRKTKYLVGTKGARCTTELKKIPRYEYQRPDDIHVFGFTSDEAERVADFKHNNWDMTCDFILHDHGVTKQACYSLLQQAGIALPIMYKLGYKNNNCIGCVKGGMGYWNKIRKDFPEHFAAMAQLERELSTPAKPRTILKDRRSGKTARLFLDELEPGRGRYESEADIECGVTCQR